MTFDCAETYRRMQDYLDRELTDEEMALVREHLAGCGMCAEEYHFEASVLRRVRREFGEIELPPDLLRRAMSAIARR
jgi:anti-sigma factor (TIGR02949 family)